MGRHLHFVQSLEPLQGGGLGTASLQLHRQLAVNGGSELFATRAPNFTEAWDGTVQCPRCGPGTLFYSSDLAHQAVKAVAVADWVHGHGLYVYTNLIFGRECRRQGKPLVYHIHGFFDPWILGRSRWKKRLAGLLFEDANLRAARFFRALTQKEADQIRAVGIKAPIAIIPNGIDLREADKAGAMPDPMLDHFQRKRPKRLLFLSRLHPKKGLEMLISAWGRVTAQFLDWELAIVGPDEGGYQKTLEAQVRAGGLEQSCSIYPALSGAPKHRLIAGADLFVLPSYSEGFPMAVLEAAAHCRPMVITSECNVPELVEEGGAWGCRPEPDSLESALAAAMSAGDGELRERGRLGRRLIEERFTWDRIARELEVACESHS